LLHLGIISSPWRPAAQQQQQEQQQHEQHSLKAICYPDGNSGLNVDIAPHRLSCKANEWLTAAQQATVASAVQQFCAGVQAFVLEDYKHNPHHIKASITKTKRTRTCFSCG
jgi:hypothetical protein